MDSPDMPTRFRGPDGQETHEPSARALRELILNAPDDYWRGGSGDAGVWRVVGDTTSYVILAVAEGSRTFHLRYVRDWKKPSYLVPRTRTDLAETMLIWVGGEPCRLPVAFFVGPEEACAVVEHFLDTGEPLPALEWVPMWEQDWDDEP